MNESLREKNKNDERILVRCLNRERFAWQEFVDRFMSTVLYVIDEVSKRRNRVLDDSQRGDLCEAIFRAFRYNDFQLLREYEYRSSLSTYLIVLARRLVFAFS